MSIDREFLRRVLAELPFESGRWVVAGSAPMLMAGLIDSIADIDIVVDSTAWPQAVSLSDQEARDGLFGDHIVALEVADAPIEVFDGWLGTPAVEMISEAVEVDGVPCSPLTRVLDAKRRTARHKDMAHIDLLEAHLADGSAAADRQPRANSHQPSPD